MEFIKKDYLERIGRLRMLDDDFMSKIFEDPKLEEGTTCRSVIAAVAELTGGYARINPAGKLEFFNLENMKNIFK